MSTSIGLFEIRGHGGLVVMVTITLHSQKAIQFGSELYIIPVEFSGDLFKCNGTKLDFKH